MHLDTYERLFEIAGARTALAVGITRPQLARCAAAGKLARSRHGVYRLTPFPRVPHEDLFSAWLPADPDAAISHDSALALYELPAHIHRAARRATGCTPAAAPRPRSHTTANCR